MKNPLTGALLSLILFGSNSIAAPSFLHIEAIRGEVSHEGYEKWIDVWSFHWAVDRAGAPHEAPRFSDLSVVKGIDAASPLLFQSAVSGDEIPMVLIDFFRDSPTEPRYLRVRLSNVFISSYTLQNGSEDAAELISLNFGRIELDQTKPDHSATTRVFYDLETQQGGTLPDGPSPGTNTAPTLSAIPDQVLEVNSSTVVEFAIDDLETSAGFLTLSRETSNAALVPLSNITFGGSGNGRTATITPVSNTFGSSVITIRVSDGNLSTATQFTVTVEQEEGPFISSIADVVIGEGDSTTVSFTIAHPSADLNSLMITAEANNKDLLPDNNIILAGSDASRTAELTPASNVTGETNITIAVSDGTLSDTSVFLLRVEAETPPPVITAPGQVEGVIGRSLPIAGISISDPAAGSAPILFTITEPNAFLTVATDVPGGLGADDIVGNGGSGITISAPVDAINITFAAKHGFSYSRTTLGSGEINLEASRSGSFSTTIETFLFDSSISLWRHGFFSTKDLNDPEKESTLWGNLANPTNDGVVNLLKYALGLSPLEIHASPDLPGLYLQEEAGSRFLAFTIVRRTDDPSLEYAPQISSDLQNWEPGGEVLEAHAATPAGSNLEQVVYRHLLDVDGPASRFIRLHVTLAAE